MPLFASSPDVVAPDLAVLPEQRRRLTVIERLDMAYAKQIRGLLKIAGGLFEMAMCTWWGIPHHWILLATGPLSLLGLWLMLWGVLDWVEGGKDRQQIHTDACAMAASFARLRKAAGIEQPTAAEIDRLRAAGFFH